MSSVDNTVEGRVFVSNMSEKEDIWSECFRIMVEYAGRMSVRDLKYVVTFFDTLTEEEQVRFDAEVESERRRRYDDLFETDEGHGGDETDMDSDDEIKDEREVITTFEDIERMNDLMNTALTQQNGTRRKDASIKNRSSR